MKNDRLARRSGPSGALAGLVVGLCATQALDWISIWLYQRERPSRRRAENRARRGRHAYEVATERLARRIGRRLRRRSVARWGWRFHKTFGILGGWMYLRLPRAFPRLAAGRGLVFGTAFFALVDELWCQRCASRPARARSLGACTREAQRRISRTASPLRARRGSSPLARARHRPPLRGAVATGIRIVDTPPISGEPPTSLFHGRPLASKSTYQSRRNQ